MNSFLPIDYSTLYVGLKNDWLTPMKVVSLLNETQKFEVDQEWLIDLNVNDTSKDYILNELEQTGNIDEMYGANVWQLSELLNIKNENNSIGEKLKQIALLWAEYNYPEAWRIFIHYVPNETASNSEDLYLDFINFLEREKQILNM